MLKHISRLRPTPSMVVSVISASVALGSAGYAATGGTFLLGVKNLATSMTTLKATTNGYGLLIQNTAGPPLALIGKAGKPPLAINSAIKVKNLNADYLDGLDSSAFVRTGLPIAHVVTIPFSVAAGGSSPSIELPTTGAVVATGVVTSVGADSIGQVTLVQAGGFLDWVGLESASPTGFAAGFAVGAGAHIVYIDHSQYVDIRSASLSAILVHNGASDPMEGFVTLMY